MRRQKLDYKAAINAAGVSVVQFCALAEREQAALENEKTPQAPERERVSNFDKNCIVKGNILNTVAATLFYKGLAAGRKQPQFETTSVRSQQRKGVDVIRT